MKDLRIELRFKNAALLNAIEQRFRGLSDAAYNGNPGLLRKASEIIGVAYEALQHYASLKKDPRHRSGKFKASALLIAEALEMDPLQLFPEHLYAERFSRAMIADVDSSGFVPLSSVAAQLKAAPDYTDDVERSMLVHEAVGKLKDKRALVINMRYGLGGYTAHCYEDIAKILDVTSERVRQIEVKALTDLRHPVINGKLREYA